MPKPPHLGNLVRGSALRLTKISGHHHSRLASSSTLESSEVIQSVLRQLRWFIQDCASCARHVAPRCTLTPRETLWPSSSPILRPSKIYSVRCDDATVPREYHLREGVRMMTVSLYTDTHCAVPRRTIDERIKSSDADLPPECDGSPHPLPRTFYFHICAIKHAVVW